MSQLLSIPWGKAVDSNLVQIKLTKDGSVLLKEMVCPMWKRCAALLLI